MNVNKSNFTIENETLYFNNKIDLKDYYASDSVASTQKIFTWLLLQYLSTNSIYVQNSYLRDYITPSRVKEIQDVKTRTRTVQKSLKYLENIGFIKARKYTYYKGNGEFTDWQLGMNKRVMYIDLKIAKELIKLIPGDITINKYKKGGTASRIMRQRPFTLVDMLMNEVIKKSVDEVNARRRVINRYLETQAKKFSSLDDDNIEFMNDCMTQVHKLFSDHVPPDLKAYLNN